MFLKAYMKYFSKILINPKQNTKTDQYWYVSIPVEKQYVHRHGIEYLGQNIIDNYNEHNLGLLSSEHQNSETGF